jgi:hypothetical protein
MQVKIDNKIPHLKLAENEIPIVIRIKNITSSSGFLTGFLNLTIERAPIIPNDKAILLEITLVITNPVGGRSAYARNKLLVLTHL